MDGPAAQEVMGNATPINGTPWWKGLNVATVRQRPVGHRTARQPQRV